MLESFAAKDNRVRIFKRNREPKGACTCRNMAVDFSTGDYLLFLDTDDLLASFCLQQRVHAMQQNLENDFCIFQMILFKKKQDDLRLLWNIEKKEDEISRLLKGDPICQGTGTLWKKKSFVDIGMWNENLSIWQDIELHLRAHINLMKYSVHFEFPPDVFIRISDESLSRTDYHSENKVKSRLDVFEYACRQLSASGRLDIYRQGLRFMCQGIWMNAIQGRYHFLNRRIKNLCKEFGLYSQKEISGFSNYSWLVNTKAARLSFLEKAVKQKIPFENSGSGETLGRVTYTEPIIL